MNTFLLLAHGSSFVSGLALLTVLRKDRNKTIQFKSAFWGLLFFELLTIVIAVGLLQPQFLATLFFLKIVGFNLVAVMLSGCWQIRVFIESKGAGRVWTFVSAGLFLLFLLFALRGVFFILASNEATQTTVLLLTNYGSLLLISIIMISLFFVIRSDTSTTLFLTRHPVAGKRVTIFWLLLQSAVLGFCFTSLTAGGINLWFLSAVFMLTTAFFISFFFLLNSTSSPGRVRSFAKKRLNYFLSSGLLIYGGFYLVFFGLLLKAIEILALNWQLFLSSFVAVSTIGLALAIVLNQSIRRRWTGFIDRNVLNRNYDYRDELQRFNEAMAIAESDAKLASIFGREMRHIFQNVPICLLLRSSNSTLFNMYMNGESAEKNKVHLEQSQIEWLRRTVQAFDIGHLLQAFPPDKQKYSEEIQWDSYEAGATLIAERRLQGVVLLGPKGSNVQYSEEELRLLDLLVNAASLVLLRLDLQNKITENKQMESIHRVSSFMMHDLRNVVSTLSLLNNNAKRHLEKKEFRHDFMQTLDRVSIEMQKLTEKLSSIKSGEKCVQKEESQLATLLENLFSEINVPASIHTQIEIEPMPPCTIDRMQMRTVFRNILMNAVEAMPHGGTLSVKAGRIGRSVKVIISDTGIGMTEDFIKYKLFRPNQSTKGHGLGIGLYQAREIVSLHDGNISAQSKTGGGTAFIIRLNNCMDTPETAGRGRLIKLSKFDE